MEDRSWENVVMNHLEQRSGTKLTRMDGLCKTCDSNYRGDAGSREETVGGRDGEGRTAACSISVCNDQAHLLECQNS